MKLFVSSYLLTNVNSATMHTRFNCRTLYPPIRTINSGRYFTMVDSMNGKNKLQKQCKTPIVNLKYKNNFLRFSKYFTNMFPLWTVFSAGIAMQYPNVFTWLGTEYFTMALSTLMLSMGITLSPSDFLRVCRRPNAVFINFIMCYGIMPLLGFALGKLFCLGPEFTAGLVLVGSINGGQASNLCTYIANGNVAQSVLMTTTTTVGCIFMTPLLCRIVLGTTVPVDAIGIMVSTLQVVLAPITLGMMMNYYFQKSVETILPFTPVVGVLLTCLLVGSAVSQVATPILNAGMQLQIPVMFLHLLGGLVGYKLCKIFEFSERTSRTVAIETAMKSSAFGFLLAKLHFGNDLVQVPSAVSVVWMSLIGSTMAVIWRYIPIVKTKFDRKLKDRFDKVNLISLINRAKMQ